MTPSALLAIVRQEFNETSSQDSFVSDIEIYNYLSEGEMKLADHTNCTEKTDATTTTVASTADYAKITDTMNIIRVTWDGVPLSKITLEEATQMFGVSYGGSAPEGNPTSYVEFGANVTLYPTPDSAETLKFWYVYEPPLLASTSTAFSVPTQFEYFLKDFALMRMYYKDEDAQIGDKHLALWENNLQVARRQWDERENWGREEKVLIVE